MTLLVGGALAALVPSSPPSDPLRAARTLVAALPAAYFEGLQLSGQRTECCLRSTPVLPPTTWVAASRAVRLSPALLSRSRRPRDRHALALLHLAARQPDAARHVLEDLVDEGGATADALNDLAVAMWLAAPDRHERTAQTVAVAVDVLARASELAPRQPNVRHNGATLLSRIGLDPSATRFAGALTRTWRSVDSVGSSTSAGVDRSTRWARVRASLRDGRTDTSAWVGFTQELREFLERDAYLPWAQGATGSAVLRVPAAVARHVGAATGDRMTTEVLRSVQGAAGDVAPALRRAFITYAEAHRLLDEGRYEQAGAAFDRAAVDFTSAACPLAAWSRTYLALTDLQLQRPNMAAARLAAVEIEAREHAWLALLGRVRWTQAVLRNRAHDLEESLEGFAEGLRIFEQLGEHENAASVASAAADTQRTIGNLDEGWRLLSAAMRHLTSVRGGARRYTITLNATLHAADDGLLRAAAVFQDAAVAAARRHGVANFVTEGLTERASLELRLGATKRAEVTLREASAAQAAIASGGSRAYQGGWIARTTGELWLDRHPERARTALTQALDVFTRVEPAEVPVLLMLRARAATRTGQLAEAWADLDEAIALVERRQERLTAEERRWLYLDGRWDVFTEAVMVLLQLNRPEEALRVAERGRLVTLQRRAVHAPSDVVASAVREMSASTACVYYVLAPKVLHAWVIDPSGSRHVVWPIDEARLGRLVAEWREALTSSSTGFESSAGQLYSLLLAPLETILAGRERLVIVPDGLLNGVPFGALITPRRQFLIEERIISVAPSLTEAVASHGTAVSRAGVPSSILAVGDPVLASGSGYPQLSGARAEAWQVGSLYRDPLVRTGAAATPEAVAAAVRGREVLHIAAHALIHDRNPRLSRLLLAPSDGHSGQLGSDDISNFDLSSCRLVVLSACSSGQGRVYRGAGPMSLARAFLTRGVPNILATHWQVDDHRMLPLMTAFHAGFLASGDPAQSLALSQRRAIAQDRAHGVVPAWAALYVVGGWQ